jgi:hypothetical protein
VSTVTGKRGMGKALPAKFSILDLVISPIANSTRNGKMVR